MESIGDNVSQAECLKEKSITFGVYLDEFKVRLEAGESQLKQLEERRAKLEDAMNDLERDIVSEKENFRKIVSALVTEECKIKFTSVEEEGKIECVDKSDGNDEESKEEENERATCAAEDMTHLDDIMAKIVVKSRDEHMESMKQFLAEKEKSKREQDDTAEPAAAD